MSGSKSKNCETADREKQTLGLSALPGPKLLEQAQRQPLHACILSLGPNQIAKNRVRSALLQLSHFVKPMLSPVTSDCVPH